MRQLHRTPLRRPCRHVDGERPGAVRPAPPMPPRISHPTGMSTGRHSPAEQLPRSRCPDLVVIPYEFDAYQEVSERMYRILLQHATLVQPMSCDEAYVDVSDCSDPVALAATLRRQIRDATRCNASVGIGPSILLAAMATKKAKPDGVFRVLPQVLPARHRPARAPRPARSHRAHHRHVPGVAGG